jgi:hypothetical protein
MTAPIFQSLLTLPAPPAPDPTAASICKSDLPLVLLPVRLETRFFIQAGGTAELRVRVYPDTIHLDSHEPDLLAVEQTAGMAYWDTEWRTGNDVTARAGTLPTAWSRLADQFGSERAAFIVRVLQPTNPEARPTAVVAVGTALSPAIAFPTVPIAPATANSWRTAPKARLLPDRWTAVATSGATTIQVTGNPIARPLNIGPDPQATIAPVPADQLAIDSGMKWMIDFTEAEAKGMGLRITLPAAVVSAGVDRLVVFGVSNSLNAADGASQLGSLLDAHHYTDGLDFLHFGTPTNNTDDRRAPQLVDEPGHARSYANEVAADPSTFAAASNANRIGAAFGLATSAIAPVLGHVAQAGDQHETNMRSMNSALWQVGWGYYLSNMVGFDGTGLTPAIVDWARDYFVTHVRAGGPFPVLRAGHQPYGVLPVTSLDLWKPHVSDETRDDWMRLKLITLRDSVWRPRLPADTLRLGRRLTTNGPNPDADLADVMRTDGVSNGYNARTVFGGQYFQHLEAYLNQNVTGIVAIAESQWTGAFPKKLGFEWRPRVTRAVGADLSWPVTAPLVQAGEVSPWKKLEPNYIGNIMALNTASLLAPLAPNDANAPKSLLEALLRHAHGREVANATAKLAALGSGLDLGAFLRDAELIDLVPDAPPPEPWRRQILRPAPTPPGTPATPINTFIDGLSTPASFTTQEVAALGDFRSSLAWLQELDSETLQYLMQGTLDLSSHRLDAWITSFATKRLAAMRSTSATGAYIGGYGWVENLHPAPLTSAVAVTTLPAGETGPLIAAANDSGFIHAPSSTHAAAAAVLRNAHLGPKGLPDANSPFAIDLSSRRVREADRLLDGVRSGQPIGALLGYRIERGLHDLGLDTAIPALRSLAPLAPAQSADANTPADAIAANNVVDGLTLAQMWTESPTAITGALTTAIGATLVGQAQNELNALTDLVDGLTDALTAEAAYQIARGNTSRAAATLSSIARGEAPPPELEVARTPRSGTPLTHRVIVLQTGTTNLSTSAWPAWNTATVSLAEPWVNSWSARLLGDPGKTRCTVERLDDSGAVVETMTFPLKELSFQPIDVVFGVEASTNASITQPAGSLSYIEQAVLFRAKRRTPGFDSSAKIRLQHARPTNLAAGEITLFDMLEQARAVRRTLAGSRGARPEDLSPTDRTAQGTVDLTELDQRVSRAENALNTAFKALQTLMASKTPITAESIRLAMLKLGPFCGGAAIPLNAAGEDAASIAALTAQANALLRSAGAMDAAFIAKRALPVEADVNARISQLTDRIAGVFGQGFVLMPHITLISTAASELTSAIAGSKVALGGDALAANSWATRYARVRDTVARFTSTLRGAEVLGTGEKLNLSVAQLPFLPSERWIGLPPLAGTPLATGKISLVLQTYTTLNFSLVVGGLLIDEWTEVVPNARETTAVTFQFDPPNAMAPQNVLVAVPPVAGVDWTADTLRRVLIETLDLAKIRAVDPEVLGETNQYLPGLYLAFNTNNDAMSTDFAPLTA